ncbi:MAG: inositol monophosphatase [Lapillicoccus sp.]
MTAPSAREGGSPAYAAAEGHAVDLTRALVVALECAEIAATVLHSTTRGEVRTKAHAADPVTDIDVATEQAVRDHLAVSFPDHVVVGEEFGGRAAAGPTWYCDPVDGTTNLASGLPWTSFSLGLALGREPLVGVVADPWRREVHHAVVGRGAYRRGPDGRDVLVTATDSTSLAGSVVLTEWAAHVPWPGMIELLDLLGREMCTSRVMGSGTLSVASVGAGRAAGAVIGDYHPEDHLAAVLIGLEAGAVVLDGSGRDSTWPEPGPFVVAAPGVAALLGDLVHTAVSRSHDGPRR